MKTNHDTVTPRQAEILRQVIQGTKRETIAGLLGISVPTVEFHLTEVRRRLRVQTTLQAAVEFDRMTRTPRPR